MKNLGDMNDLYNAQDVILLTEIVENRFQTMYKTYGFNPRKCNSASTLSGSSVNTRLAFDTQILLPNLNVNDKKQIIHKIKILIIKLSII